MIQSRGFLGRLLDPLAKSVAIQLGLTAAASAANAGICFSMLLGTLGASLLGNMLAGKGVVRAEEGMIRVGYRSFNLHLKKTLRYKSIIKVKLDSMELHSMKFILEIIYLIR